MIWISAFCHVSVLLLLLSCAFTLLELCERIYKHTDCLICLVLLTKQTSSHSEYTNSSIFGRYSCFHKAFDYDLFVMETMLTSCSNTTFESSVKSGLMLVILSCWATWEMLPCCLFHGSYLLTELWFSSMMMCRLIHYTCGDAEILF